MSAETLVARLDALWLEMNDALAEPPATARILNALHDAAQALRTPPAPTEAVAVLEYAQQVATHAAKRVGCVDEWRPLDDVYGCLSQIDNCLTGLTAIHPPQPDALPGDLRERVARRAAAAILEQDGYSADGPYLNADLTLDYLDQGEVDFGKVADAILSLIQSERGGA